MAVKRVAVQLHAVNEIIYSFMQMLTVNKWISGCLLKRYGRDVSRRIVLLPEVLGFFFRVKLQSYWQKSNSAKTYLEDTLQPLVSVLSVI